MSIEDSKGMKGVGRWAYYEASDGRLCRMTVGRHPPESNAPVIVQHLNEGAISHPPEHKAEVEWQQLVKENGLTFRGEGPAGPSLGDAFLGRDWEIK